MTNTNQKTFGKVQIKTIPQNSHTPKCERKNKDQTDCENRARIVITNSHGKKAKYTCKSHARKAEIEMAGIEE